MHTPSHIIINLALLGGKKKQKFHFPIFLGALLPDVSMFIFVGIEKFQGVPINIIFDTDYYLPFWQSLFDIGHSFPLIALGALVCFVFKKYWGVSLFASMFLHSLFDFPLHHDDTHRHFWPFLDYRFYSPISYWDPNHFGDIFSKIEVVLVVLLSAYLFTILKTTAAKCAVVFLNICIIGGALFFLFRF